MLISLAPKTNHNFYFPVIVTQSTHCLHSQEVAQVTINWYKLLLQPDQLSGRSTYYDDRYAQFFRRESFAPRFQATTGSSHVGMRAQVSSKIQVRTPSSGYDPKHVSPYAKFVLSPTQGSFKKLILSTALRHKLKTMSEAKSVPKGLKDQEVEKGNVKKRPPIPYVPVVDEVQEAVKGKDST